MICLFRFQVQILQNYVSALKNWYPTIHFCEMIDWLDAMKCENEIKLKMDRNRTSWKSQIRWIWVKEVESLEWYWMVSMFMKIKKIKIEYLKKTWSGICEMWDVVFLKCYYIMKITFHMIFVKMWNVKCLWKMFEENNVWNENQAIVQCVMFVT